MMVYFFDSYETLNLNEASALLPAERLKKFSELKQIRDKENCLAGYLLLKYALNELGIESFAIGQDDNGKPYLQDCDIHFNLSHCRHGVAVAVSRFPVGIDVQEITEYNSGVARRVFSDKEINCCEKDDKAFTRIWTLKEAAAKCDGRGIAALKDFCFDGSELHFTKYGRYFSTFERKSLFVSVCGGEDFSDIKDIKALEVTK